MRVSVPSIGVEPDAPWKADDVVCQEKHDQHAEHGRGNRYPSVCSPVLGEDGVGSGEVGAAFAAGISSRRKLFSRDYGSMGDVVAAASAGGGDGFASPAPAPARGDREPGRDCDHDEQCRHGVVGEHDVQSVYIGGGEKTGLAESGSEKRGVCSSVDTMRLRRHHRTATQTSAIFCNTCRCRCAYE